MTFPGSPTGGPYVAIIALLVSCLDGVRVRACDGQVERYVKLADSTARDSLPCGETKDRPCATLDLALRNRTEDVPTKLILLASGNNSDWVRESFANTSNVCLDASEAGLLELHFNDTNPSRAWVEFVNSSNIAFSHLNVSLSLLRGRAAVLLRDCYNVSVEYCSFLAPVINSSALRIINCWPFSLVGSNFIGPGQIQPSPQLNEAYNLSAVMLSYTCDASTCPQDNPPPSGGVPIDNECCSGLPALSGESPLIMVDSCRFLRLGIAPVYGTYYRTLWEEAVTIHLEVFNTSRLSAKISNSQFLDNISPYDAGLKVYLGAGARNSSLTIMNNVFKNSWCYIGCAFFFRIERFAEENEMVVRNNTFCNNTAYIEGGAVAWSVFSPTNKGLLEDNTFHMNRGGPLSGVGQVGGAISAICTSAAAQSANLPQKSQFLASLLLTRCTFYHNSASYGSAIFLRGIYAQLENV